MHVECTVILTRDLAIDELNMKGFAALSCCINLLGAQAAPGQDRSLQRFYTDIIDCYQLFIATRFEAP